MDSTPKVKRPSYLGGPGTKKAFGDEPASSKKGKAPAEKPESDRKEPKEDAELHTWRVWLFPRRPLVSAGVVLVIVLSLGFAYRMFPQPIFLLIFGVILMNRLATYLFPVNYTLTEETVGYRAILVRDVREWSRFFTYREFPDGVLLSHDVRSLRGRMREGLFLYYKDDLSNKDDVLQIVRAKLDLLEKARKEDAGDPAGKGGFRSALRRIRAVRKRE